MKILYSHSNKNELKWKSKEFGDKLCEIFSVLFFIHLSDIEAG